MIGMLGIVVVFIMIIIVAKRRKRDLYREEVIEDTTRIIYDNKSQRDEVKAEKHTVTKLLIYNEDSSIWICPLCETENQLSKQRCCICYYEQQEGV